MLARRAAGPAASLPAALSLELEARDARTAADVVLQFVAFRPTPGAPPPPASLYFTFNFFHFAAIATEHAYVVPSAALAAAYGSAAAGAGAPSGAAAGGGPATTTSNIPPTCLLLPAASAQQRGAGLVLKLSVDGSAGNSGDGEVAAAGSEALAAAHDTHVSFCRYLATRALHLDLWDGESLLQVGGVDRDSA